MRHLLSPAEERRARSEERRVSVFLGAFALACGLAVIIAGTLESLTGYVASNTDIALIVLAWVLWDRKDTARRLLEASTSAWTERSKDAAHPEAPEAPTHGLIRDDCEIVATYDEDRVKRRTRVPWIVRHPGLPPPTSRDS